MSGATGIEPLRQAAAFWRAAKGPVAVGLVVVVAGVTLAVLAGQPARGLLDPDAVDASGSRALVRLLEARGVTVTPVRTSREVAEAGPDATVLVTFPERLQDASLRAVHGSGADLVLVSPEETTLAVLAPGSRVAARNEAVETREPDCSLPEAVAAGPAELGGLLYRTPGGTECYREEAGAALVRVGERGRMITVLGTPAPLTNGELTEDGNAALALRLLGAKPRLLWYLPGPEALPGGATRRPALGELVPPGWLWGSVQLAIAGLLATLWRARRLGPVVTEPLPAVVRAVEVTEGRGRLYRRAGARGHAADILRAASRARLAPLVGLGRVENTGSPEDGTALVDALAARTGRPAEEIRNLLDGPVPGDDAALVRLADRLDAHEREVRRT